MKTIFLTSGLSSRMAPISDKNLLSFGGKPMCVRLMENVASAGLENFVVVTNKENGADVEKVLETAGLKAQFTVQQDNGQGLGGGVKDGLGLVDDDEAVMVISGNDYVSEQAYALVAETGANCDGSILGKRVETYFPGGYMEVNEQQKILSIVEKPGEGNEPSDLVNMVVHYFARAGDLRQALEEALKEDLEKDHIYESALQKLFATQTFKAVGYDGPWQSIKYPWYVLEMMDLLLGQQETLISEKANVADSAVLEGDGIVVEDGAKIHAHATIVGPCYIGRDVMVGNGALVRQSNIGEGSVVGYNTEIARSFLGKHVTTHIAYIGDSVVDDGANFGAFSTTANLRLDRKTVRVEVKGEKIDSRHGKLGAIVGREAQIGIHAMLMPGAKIDVEEFIGPGEVKK